MENIEKNEIVNTETIEDLTTEATSTNGSVIKTVGIIGLGVVGAALLTKYVVVPVVHKVKRTIQQKKATKKVNTAEAEEIDLSDVELDEIPEIDE
jgi:hypothetical protein|nr:MAG TPA: dihydrodipicolinate reductase [Caudoviricetes sp.]